MLKHSFFFIFVSLIFTIPVFADLTCQITTSCPAGSTALLYLKNDTGGFDNAHAELPSAASYPNVLCCSSASSINSSCGTIFLELSDTSNAHVQDPSYVGADYSYDACISSNGTLSCSVYASGCPTGKTCLVSIASDGTSNLTNAHVGSCNEYDTDVCCSINSLPSIVVLYDPTNGNVSDNSTPTFVWYNATDADSPSLSYHLQVDEVESGFSSPVVDVSAIPEGSSFTSYTINDSLSFDVNYSWRVRAYDGVDYGDWSDSWTFTIPSPAVPPEEGGGEDKDFEVKPSKLKVNIRVGETKVVKLIVKNTGRDGLDFTIILKNLEGVTVDPESFSLSYDDEQVVTLTFDAEQYEPGTYEGEIIIKGDNLEKHIGVSIKVLPKIPSGGKSGIEIVPESGKPPIIMIPSPVAFTLTTSEFVLLVASAVVLLFVLLLLIKKRVKKKFRK
ncbi:MAG: fibronectin type III domain-containing protein [Candidatus Nanoarchaeia archaeon]